MKLWNVPTQVFLCFDQTKSCAVKDTARGHCHHISLSFVLCESHFCFCRTTSTATLLSQDSQVQIFIFPSRCFLLSLDIVYCQSKGCTESGRRHTVCTMFFGVTLTSLSFIQHIKSCPLVEKVRPYLTPCATWFLDGHRDMLAFLCVASTSIQIGIISSSCYLFSCSAMLDKCLCEAIVTYLYLASGQRTTACFADCLLRLESIV